MEYEDLAVGGEPQVALNSGPELERSGESDQAVLGKGGTGMQPAMGEAGFAGI